MIKKNEGVRTIHQKSNMLTWILWPFQLIFQLLGLMLLSWCLGCLLAFLMVFFLGDSVGLLTIQQNTLKTLHALQRFEISTNPNNEVKTKKTFWIGSCLSSNLSSPSESPYQTSIFLAQQLSEWLFIKTHIMAFFEKPMHVSTLDSWGSPWKKMITQLGVFSSTSEIHFLDIEKIHTSLSPYGLAWMAISQAMIIRWVVVFGFLPNFILLGAIGFVDGCVLRKLRQWRGSYESAFMHHIGKCLIRWVGLLSLFFYAIFPFPISPEVILLPAAISWGFSMSLTIQFFKKYL